MRQDIEELLLDVNANYARDVGGPIVQLASEVTNPFMLRRPTGIVSLDVALGGGFPAGTLCQVSSPEGVGKNALCNQTAAQVQRVYGEDACIAWICTEMSLDKEFAHMFGVAVPMSDFEISMMNSARESPMSEAEVEFRKNSLGTFLIVDNGSSAQRLEVALKLIQSNKFQLIVIDSLASLLPEAAEETELQDEPQQSVEARLITRFCQKYWAKCGQSHTSEEEANWTTVLATYQVRANRSMAKFKKAWSVGGAHALRHAKAIDIHMENAGAYPKDPNKPTLGKTVRWKIAKGKAGCHEGPKGEILYLHKEGYDVYADLFNYGKSVDVFRRGGKWWKFVTVEGNEVESIEGGNNGVTAKLVGDESFFWKVYSECTRAGGVQCVYKL